jgi:VCBS repeat-containing protein
LQVHSEGDVNVDSSFGVLINDTDCADDTENRGSNGGVKGVVCSSDTDVNQHTDNGDSIEVTSCNGGCLTSAMDANIVINPNGSFTYDPTVSKKLACDLTGPQTDTISYTIRDARGGSSASSKATITINIDVGTDRNNAPASTGTKTYTYDMRNQSGSISGNLTDLFTDADNDSLTYSPNVPNKYQDAFNRTGNEWSFNPFDDSDLVELETGDTKKITINVTADDGFPYGNCNTATNKIEITVTGSAPPPTPTPTTPPSRDGGGGTEFGGGES